MLGLLRLALIICGLLLILLGGLLTLSRAGADGAYWLLSSNGPYFAGGLYVQEPGQSERRLMRGFDDNLIFEWWSADQKWLYSRSIEPHDGKHFMSVLSRSRLGSRQWECAGRKIVQLGTDALTDFTPSPDEQWVAFVTPEGEPNRLYVTRGDCENPNQVISIEDETIDSLFWSPDGTWLYFHTLNEFSVPSLYRVRPDGSGLELLARTHVELRETDKSWQWSPNGAWVLLRACDGYFCSLHVAAADGSAYMRFRNPLQYAQEAFWTPDSQWVFFRDQTYGPGGYDIFRFRPDTLNVEVWTQLPTDALYGLTPDGEWILFSSIGLDSQTFNRMRPDGSEHQVLFETTKWLDETLAVQIVSDEWIYISDYVFGDLSVATLYRLQTDGSDVELLVSGITISGWGISPDEGLLLAQYGNHSAHIAEPTLFHMKLDGSEQTHIPLETDLGPTQFSPLFNLPWRSGWIVAVGMVMVALGIVSGRVR